jgi:hypothetical protein
MRRRVPAVAILCALVILLSSQPASAAIASRGGCLYGGRWRLTVDQYDATHLRVVFVIRSGAPGSIWQLFGSDNDHPFVTKTKTADLSGIVRVRWRPLDRIGLDVIEAAGSGPGGNLCNGQVSF